MNQKKRILSAVLCLVFAFSLFAGAADTTAPEDDTTVCTCTSKCAEGAVNQECPVCKDNYGACTFVVTEEPKETETLKETEVPQETETPKETEVPQETETPKETEVPQETETPKETEAPKETETPKETEVPKETETPKDESAPVSISSWNWVGTDSLNEGVLPLTTIASIEDITEELFAEVVKLLPSGIQAEGVETVIPVTWKLENLVAAGEENMYTITAVLPEGYVLAEGAAALSLPVLLGGGIADTLEPTTRNVTNYDELLKALADAKDGDTIVLAEGTYAATGNEQLRITVPNITIKGAGQDKTVINTGSYSVSGQAGILVQASGVTISDLSVNSNAGDGVSAIKFTNLDGANLSSGTIAMVSVSSEGHGLNVHGVDNMNVAGLGVISAGKCGLSIANSPKVTVFGSSFAGTTWADIGMMYEDNSASYSNPSNLVFGNGNGFSNSTVIYSERPETASGGRDSVSVETESSLVMLVGENGKWAVVPSSDSVKALVRNLRTRLYYTGIEEALKDAIAGDTIILYGDVQVDKMLDISKDGVTIDLSGHSITAAGDFKSTYDNDSHVVNVSGDNVTIKNGTIAAGSDNKHALNIYQANGVKLEGLTLDHTNAAKGAPLVVNASDVTVSGALDLKVGTNSWYGINVDPKNGMAASLNFADGSSLSYNGGANTPAILSENGGAVTGSEKVGIYMVKTDEGVVGVDQDTAAQALAKNETTGIYYSSLEAAIADVKTDETITLMDNVALGAMLNVKKDGVTGITLDLNGKVITAADDFHKTYDNDSHVVNVEMDSVTIKNGTITATSANKHALNIFQAKDVKLENLTLDHTNAAKGAPLVVNASDVTVGGALNLKVGANSWYGINVDPKQGSAAISFADGSTVTMTGNDALKVLQIDGKSENVTVTGAEDAGLTNNGDGSYSGGHVHTYTWNWDDSKHWKECSCSSKIDEGAHSFEKVIVPATDTTAGYSLDRCTVCGYETNKQTIAISVKITHGDKAKWLYGSNTGLTFRSNGELDYFKALYIDGVLVNPQYYSTESGSTILKLSSTYLKSLSVGKHTLRMEFDTASSGYANAYADTVFYTYTLTSSPFTGDESNMMLWTAMMVMAAAGMGVAIILIKRRGARS